MASTPPRDRIDARLHRFDQGIAAIALLAAWVFQQPWVLPVWAVILTVSGLVGPRGAPFQILFSDVLTPRLHPPQHFEDPVPLQAASLFEAAFLALASIVAFTVNVLGLAWLLGLTVGALAAFEAASGICLLGRVYDRARGQ